MPSVRNFNYVDVPSISVVVQSTVRPLELKQYYPPWTKEFGNRPALGFVYPSPVIPVTVIQNANRLVMKSTIFRTDNIFNTNKFNTPVTVANNNPTKLFTTGTVVQPVLASSGYGNGTIGTVTTSVTSYGANVWSFNLSDLSTTRSLSNGKIITSAPGTGRFSSTVVVDSVINSTTISCIASGTTAPVQGIVRTVQDSGRLFELAISSVIAISATEWKLTISGIFDSSVFLIGDAISVVTGSGNFGSLGTGNMVYVISLPNANQITCTAINGSAAPTVGKISSLSKTGVNIPFTPNGEIEYTTPGTYTWTAPTGVGLVSVVAVGGGGGGGYQWSSGGGGGGGLGWKNNITVTPGQTYTVVVGVGGTSNANATNAGSEGGNSYFISLTTVAGYGGGRGGTGATSASNGYGGGYTGDGGGRGGNGGYDGGWYRGGAGAGGYSGNGADSGTSTGTAAPAGSGAGAAAGYYSSTYGVPAGGGVGIYGRGADGAARGNYLGGGGGSGGANGIGGEGSGQSGYRIINGGAFGGGGGGSGTSYGGGFGGGGAVRIVWGPGKAFPATNVASTGSQSQEAVVVWYDSTIVSVPSLLTTPLVNKQLFRQNAITSNKTVITDSTIKPNLPARIFNSISTVNSTIVILNGARTTTTGISSRIPILGTNNGVNYSDTVTNNSSTARATVNRFPNTGDFSVVGPYQNSFSTYFDGSGDYLQINGNFVMNFGSTDFTVEAWVYLNALPTSDAWPTSWSLHMMLATVGTVNAGDGIGFIIGQTKLLIQNNDTQYAGTAHGMAVNTWYHLAYVRNGNIFYFYVNGVAKGSAAFSGSAGTGANTFIGSETGQGAFLNGYISNLRVVKGTAVYTSAFTPPTALLTAIANTSLLTCKTQLIEDQSTNTFTITKFGDVKYSQLNPFISNSGSQGHSVTQVRILGVTDFNQTAVPLSTISQSVKINNSVALETIIPSLVYNPVGSPNSAVQTIYSNRFARQTNNNIGNEATEPVLVYIRDTVINGSNKPKWIITNSVNTGYTPNSAVATVNANKIPNSYVRPSLSNAFSITTANKPNVLSRYVSSFSNLATTATIFGQSLLESLPLEPITKTVITDSIVAGQVRTTLTASQGVNSGLSRSFTLAPYGTAGALVIGEGGLLVSAQTEFWN